MEENLESYFEDKTKIIEEDLEFTRLTNNFSGCTGYKVIFEEDGLHYKNEIFSYESIYDVHMASNVVMFTVDKQWYSVVLDNSKLARKFYIKLLYTKQNGFEEIILESIDEIEKKLEK